MTRFVTLMNPRPRRRVRRSASGRFIRVRRNPSTRRRRTVSRIRRVRRFHRNPSSPPKMTPAMRRKISLAVKAANRRRAAAGGSRAVVRRSAPSRSTVVYRRSRSMSRGGFGSNSLVGSFKNALSKQLLMKAGGAVLASVGTGYILNRFSASLPLANHQYGRILYTLGIPVAGAYLLHKKNRDLAEGLVIGGLVMSINTLMQGFRATTTAVPTAAQGSVGAYGVAGELDGSFGYYPQGSMDSHGLGGSNVAFPDSAW